MTKLSIPTNAGELAELLVKLFPPFAESWTQALADHKQQSSFIGYDTGVTFHQVLQVFAPVSSKLLQGSSSEQIESFCQFINQSVSESGPLENAISTCLLEHATQLGIHKTLQPQLSQGAKNWLR